MDFHVRRRVVGFRVVVLPGREAAMMRLCTNLPRTPFSRDLVGRLCRFRWPIERCFKGWKSYANLHQFDTANAHIVEGLIASVSVFAAPSAGVSPICWPPHDVPIRIAIVALAAYAPGWASRRSLT